VNPLGSGIQLMLVDTSDKSRPVPSDSVFLTGQSLGDPDRLVQPSSPTSLLLGGYHSVEVADINGTDYVFAFGDVYRIDRTEQGGRLVYVSHFSVGHDMYIRETPDGRFWALAANGFGDFAIHDVTDPTDPVELGRWDIPDRDGLDGGRYLHTADVAFLDGRALVVVTSEDWEDHASPFWVLDATDPSNITMLGSWHNPWNHTALGIHFSLHNPRFHDDGILTMAQYHGGMVQFDFRHASTWSDPYLAAYAVTAKGSTASPRDPVEHAVEAEVCQLTTIEPGVGNDTPLYMDVEYAPDGSGIVYAADLTGGLYTFKPTTDHPVYGNATRSAGHVH
jgi:hypothetical protein